MYLPFLEIYRDTAQKNTSVLTLCRSHISRWFSWNQELRLIKFFGEKHVCMCLVLVEDGKGPGSSIDHLSRVIQSSIDKISVGAVATKRGFCVDGWGKILWSPRPTKPRRGIPSIWSKRTLLTEWAGRDQTCVREWFGQWWAPSFTKHVLFSLIQHYQNFPTDWTDRNHWMKSLHLTLCPSACCDNSHI